MILGIDNHFELQSNTNLTDSIIIDDKIVASDWNIEVNTVILMHKTAYSSSEDLKFKQGW